MNIKDFPQEVQDWIEEYSSVFAYENGNEEEFDRLKSFAEDVMMSTYNKFICNAK